MKKILLILIAICFVSYANAAVVGTFMAKAKLKRLFTLTQLTEVNFGTIYISDITGSTIQLHALDGSILSTGEAILAGGHTLGLFKITSGDANASINVTVGSINLTNGTDTITATLNLVNGTGTHTITLDASGQADVEVGGDLKIPAGVSSGDYSGMFTVDAVYN